MRFTTEIYSSNTDTLDVLEFDSAQERFDDFLDASEDLFKRGWKFAPSTSQFEGFILVHKVQGCKVVRFPNLADKE